MLIMHENWKSNFEKEEQTEFWFSCFLMVLDDVRVWTDSKKPKEQDGMLKID